MSLVCRLAERTKIRAFYIDGNMIIHAKVMKHSNCDIFKVSKSVLDIEPPTFILQCCRDNKPCDDQWLNEEKDVTGIFYVGIYREKVNVAHSGGTDTIKVQKLLDKSENLTDGGGPVPFLIPPDFNAPVEKIKERKPSQSRGYSQNFSIEEAMRDAINNVTLDPPQYPDELRTVVVKNIGVLYGGIIGFAGTLYVDITT